jgi:hypothetical protein
MHKLVTLHDTTGSVKPRRDNKPVQCTLSYVIEVLRPPAHAPSWSDA